MRKYIPGILFAAITTYNLYGSNRPAYQMHPDTVVTNLREVEVSASRQIDELHSSVPSQKINSERILTTGITDIADAMHRLAGVNLRDYGGAGGLKTVSVRGLGAQHTGVILDGAPLSDMQTGQIDLSRYSLDNIGSLTLNIGDSDDVFTSARAVSSAANIVINSMTYPELMSTDPTVHAKLRLASFSTVNPYFRFAKSNGRNFAFSTSADFTNALNDYPYKLVNASVITREHRSNSLVNSGHADFDLIWKPSVAQTLRAKVYYYDNARQLPGPVIYYAPESNERLRERNAFGQLDYRGRLSSLFSIKGLAKFNWSTSRYRDINGKYPNGELDDYYIQNEEYLSATLLCKPLSDLDLSYAADYFHNYLTDNSGKSAHPARDSFLQALSARYRVWRLTASFHGLLSLINDRVPDGDDRFSSRFSPSVSIALRLLQDTDWNLRLSYKNIFRMPTFNELYFEHFGTVNLDPEITDQFNLGMTYSFPRLGCIDRFDITVDGYFNKVSNKIVAVPYNMFIWTMTNMGKVRSMGCDMTIGFDFRISDQHHIEGTGNYSYQRTAQRSDRNNPDWNKQLPYTPLNSGAWSLTWLNPWVNFVIHGSGCSARYSTSVNVAETRMAGYMEFGFSLYREFRCRASRWEIRADMINAFNRQYEVVRRYPMPGRAFSITFGYRLN